jgi:glutamate-1-semialdehyde 2,1-aminomutase
MAVYFPGARSAELFQRARQVIPGGVNSPVRAFRQVGGDPIFFARGEGPYVFDVDGRRYIDYVGSWGPLILGHAPQFVTEILTRIAVSGTSFGAPTELEVLFAEKISELIPSMEMVRCVSSGTEATMSAIRLARAFTGRKRLLKFSGCYHGHADSLLVKAGSGVATLGIPGSPGVPEELASLTLSIEYNNLDLVEKTLAEVGPETVAAVLIEPVAGNMGLIKPGEGFLQGLREICSAHGILLIFDEVMTGFRVALGGAQARYGITPDLTTLGKVIGGGLPVGAFGGRREIMEQLAPSGGVYQAGTLSGNPLALGIGLEMLNQLSSNDPYPALEQAAARLTSGMKELAAARGIQLSVDHCGSMFGFFFSKELPVNYSSVAATDIAMFKRFFHAMLEAGVYFAPSAFEAGFLGVTHTPAVIGETLEAVERGLARLN